MTAPDVTYTDGTITFSNPSLPSQVFTVVLFAPFIPWNSNRYTLDYVIAESYYQNLPDPTEIPMPFALSYFLPEPGAPYLNYQPFGITFPDKHFFDLELAPGEYWLPEWNPA